MKFRLIGKTEMESLQGKLQVLGEYLEQFCPQVAIELKQCSECPAFEKPAVWGESSNALIIFDESLLQDLQLAIVGDRQDNETYTELCQTVLNESFGHFFGCQTLEAHINHTYESWFYPGSPNLQITLILNERQCRFILNGQWVLNHLELVEQKGDRLESIDDALCNEKIPLTVNLPPMALSLEQINQLQTGDIIQLDQKVTQPLQLCCKNIPIAKVMLGNNSEFKAVKTV